MPFLSDSFTVSDFGNIIFTLGVLNLITAIFSASMSNYRLKLGRDIDDSKSLNDFFILFLMALIVALPIAIIVTFLADIFNELFLLYCALLMFRVFGTSFLRLKLDYNSIAVISFLLAGTILFASWFSESDLNSKNWPLLLIIPEVFASIYLNFKIKIFSIKRFREVSNINILRKTLRMHLKSYFFFMFLQLAESSFTYIDRVILKFGFGSEMVADFFILTSLAKFQPVIFNMISGVLLSYLAFSNENLWLKHKIKLLAVIPAISIMSIVTILIFDDLFIHKFYPKTSLEGLP